MELKASLRGRQSALWPGKRLALCNRCYEGKYEPRWMILLLLASGEREKVKPFIDQHLYVGDPIQAIEFV